MRKVISELLAVTLTLSLCGCTTKLLTIKQSEKNFPVYESDLIEVANNYNFELIEVEDDSIEDDELSEKTFNITIDDDTEIEIWMKNDALSSSATGRESFSVDYVTHKPKSFDVSLFVDLVNCISGKEITEDFCNEFLKAPEEEYSAEDRGYEKPSEDVIAKEHPLNFF